MNAIRILLSLFMVVLIGVATTGWIWVGGHQPGSESAASRVVLSVCILAGLVGLAALWRRRY
jgi:MYXO-CTERM domain-containing protein